MAALPLKIVLAQHELWISSNQKEGKRAHLELTNLQGVDLEKVYLQGANLKEADLQGVDLRNANLQGVDLRNANLQGADLQGANLQGAYLREANLREAYLRGAYLQGADLHKADLKEANLQKADLKLANLENADLQNAELQEADFKMANLQNANLQNADLRSADLRNANFDYCRTDAETYEVFLSDSYSYEKNIGMIIPKGLSPDINSSTRTIEFPPEHHQAGMNILSYFQTVLRKKYPNDKVKVKIEQDGLKVAMTIESPEGKPLKKYEEALDEYGLVLGGKMNPEQLLNDERDVMELLNQLSMAKYQCEINERLICRYEKDLKEIKTDYRTLLAMVGEAVNKNLNANHVNNVYVHNAPNLSISIKTELPQIQGALNELKEELPLNKSDEIQTIQQVQDSLDHINDCKDPGEVAKSSAMSKLGRFLENVNNAESTISRAIKQTKNGIDIVQKVARHYNSIAEWCGLPTIPQVFLKHQTSKRNP